MMEKYFDPVILSDYIILSPYEIGKYYYLAHETVLKKIDKYPAKAPNIVKMTCIGAIARIYQADLVSGMDAKRLCVALKRLEKDGEGLSYFYEKLQSVMDFLINIDTYLSDPRAKKTMAKSISDKRMSKEFLKMPDDQAKTFLLGLNKIYLAALIQSVGLEEDTYRLSVPQSYDEICQSANDRKGELLIAFDLPLIESELAAEKIAKRLRALEAFKEQNVPDILLRNEYRMIYDAKMMYHLANSKEKTRDKLDLYHKIKKMLDELINPESFENTITKLDRILEQKKA